ncbi:hypothetical protein NEOKW01_1490 [Nematocida sp. AWRm80]|nr:hypothetical protein NEOKW01_1490 [Nematocida sp. AWRm80]
MNILLCLLWLLQCYSHNAPVLKPKYKHSDSIDLTNLDYLKIIEKQCTKYKKYPTEIVNLNNILANAISTIYNYNTHKDIYFSMSKTKLILNINYIGKDVYSFFSILSTSKIIIPVDVLYINVYSKERYLPMILSNIDTKEIHFFYNTIASDNTPAVPTKNTLSFSISQYPDISHIHSTYDSEKEPTLACTAFTIYPDVTKYSDGNKYVYIPKVYLYSTSSYVKNYIVLSTYNVSSDKIVIICDEIHIDDDIFQLGDLLQKDSLFDSVTATSYTVSDVTDLLDCNVNNSLYISYANCPYDKDLNTSNIIYSSSIQSRVKSKPEGTQTFKNTIYINQMCHPNILKYTKNVLVKQRYYFVDINDILNYDSLRIPITSDISKMNAILRTTFTIDILKIENTIACLLYKIDNYYNDNTKYIQLANKIHNNILFLREIEIIGLVDNRINSIKIRKRNIARKCYALQKEYNEQALSSDPLFSISFCCDYAKYLIRLPSNLHPKK